MIKFAPGYKEAIENETKKITIRKGIVPNIFPGQIEDTNIGLQLRIKSVRYCYFDSLSDPELQDDGFSSQTNCMEILEQFYGEINKYDLCTIIRFEKVDGGR